MTTKELKDLEEILLFSKGRTYTDYMFNKIKESLKIIQRELRLKNYDYIKDVDGNLMNKGD